MCTVRNDIEKHFSNEGSLKVLCLKGVHPPEPLRAEEGESQVFSILGENQQQKRAEVRHTTVGRINVTTEHASRSAGGYDDSLTSISSFSVIFTAIFPF
ncbi:hypothetical protein POVWA2_097250 [Plasmodium ovale wallikeri]|uniref:Uncharacterized protein n=1 Tax=Plasmodium ovale wallikeri TaxID=864142 RepID=A0A1A9ATJ7_PLAOA|nr:hypothetical protein POVWA1_088080 [Plasmodium ovale wallikeri]SBT59494.1 hypothetical protein POVWA2_097250 [Plasmodium ovale wallikeri]